MRSPWRVYGQRIPTAVFILVFATVAIVTEQWLAELLDDDLIATMLMLIGSIVIIAFVSPLVVRAA